MRGLWKNTLSLLALVIVLVITLAAVGRFHKPGQLDVISAQAMDMSAMRPPTGAAPVSLASVRRGSLDDTVTYTGSVLPFNEQEISPRITGALVSLPVYPGDRVRAGQLVAQLDSAELSAKTQQAIQAANGARINAQVAHLTHHLHHRAAVAQATAQYSAAAQGVSDAQAEAQAGADAIADAQAGVQSAQASAEYWKTEIAREKQLADAGAVSRQEYQSEQAQAQAAFAALTQSQAKVNQAKAMARAAQAKVLVAKRQVDAAQASEDMAQADLVVAEAQAAQAQAGASQTQAAVREAAVVQGYTRITAPFSGVVTSRPVAPGTLVQPGTVILKVADIGRVRVQANIAASDLTGIHVGTAVEIAMQNGGDPIPANVSSVFPSANTSTRTAVIEAVVANPARQLQPGAFVTMRITKRTGAAELLVPASSIVSQGGQSYVWIAKGAGASKKTEYECAICHMYYSAEQAAKYHYIDPMDGGKLTPIQSSNTPTSNGGATAHKVIVQIGASDGVSSEVTSDELTSTDKVIDHGMAGLTEGARMVVTEWAENGPKSLPDAASANAGLTVYRCEKCGMTYSEADAKKNNFIDPMDGGKLTPVKGSAQ
jgi:multidrug efflux pump subunit AcrA (membrane-fusion protein)